MKRLVTFLLAGMLVCYSGMVCYAGDTATGEKKEQTTFGFYATYLAGETNYFTAPVQQGNTELELPDGTVITVSGMENDDWTLVVYPVTAQDADAWKWFSACFEGKGSKIAPYEIYFLDGNGERILAENVTIGISLPETLKAPTAFSLDKDGAATALPSAIRDGKIVFKADASYYYVLAEKADADNPTPPAGEETETPVTPPSEETETPATPSPGEETETPTTPSPGEETESPTEPSPGEETETPTTPLPGEETETPTTPTSGGETKPPATPAPGTGGNNQGTGIDGTAGNQASTAQGDVVRTGDETNIAGWLAALVLAGGCMIILAITAKRKKKKNGEH